MRIKYDIAKMVTGTIGAGFILYMATNSFLHEVVRWCCVASAIGILFWIVSRVTFIKKHETVWMFVITCVAAIPFNIKVSKTKEVLFMLKELKKNKMSVVATGILFGVMGVLIIPMIAVIIKISNALSQKHPRIYKYSMIAFIGMLLAISLFCVVIKHQMSFLVIVACLAITLCDTIKNR